MKKNIFETINKYLTKQGHDLIYSLYLDNYNKHHIYVRFDYDKKINVYKIVWYDLDFIDIKHLEYYTNVQMVTSFIGNKLDDLISKIQEENKYKDDDENIIGDRVEMVMQNSTGIHEYVFQRFLPKEWNFLLDIIVLTFNYLPKSMEVMINEILAEYSNCKEYYNSKKPFKFDLLKDDLDTIFNEKVNSNVDKVSIEYLEKFNDTYKAITNYKGQTDIVYIEEQKNGFIVVLCTEDNGFCPQERAVIEAIRGNVCVPFIKVKFIMENEDLYHNLVNSQIVLCCGHTLDSLKILTDDFNIINVPIKFKGKNSFKVIEDDDEQSITNFINGSK